MSIWIAMLPAAVASSTAGMGLTPMGGGMSGITEPGVLGISATPSAAVSKSAEIAIDGGANFYSITAALDGATPEQASGMVPMPFFGATMPYGPWGIGVYGMIPYGGGISMSEDGAQRFHSIESRGYLVEGGLALARQVSKRITLGSTVRVGRATLRKDAAMNTAALINGRTELSPPLDTDDPLLHGRQVLDVSGLGIGFGLGASVALPHDWSVHLGYRSPMSVPVSGTADIRPSDGIPLSMTGDAMGRFTYAQELELGVVVPIGIARLSVMGGWTDWSGWETVDIEVNNLAMSSDNDAMESLLSTTDVNEADIMKAGTSITNDLGNSSAFHGGIGLSIPIGSRYEVRPAAYYAGTTIPDETFHAGIVDFPAYDLRLSASHTPVDWLTVGLSFDHFVVPDRTVRNSSLSFDNKANSGRTLNSANGRYTMRAHRAGLTLIARR